MRVVFIAAFILPVCLLSCSGRDDDLRRQDGGPPDAGKLDASLPDLGQDGSNPDGARPDKGKVKPDKGTVKPDKGKAKPDKGTVKPDKGTVKPDKGTVKPDKGTVKPDAAAIPGAPWSMKIGGTGADRASAVATDSLGNVLVAGGVTGPATVGKVNVPVGKVAAVLIKISPAGKLLWTVALDGISPADMSPHLGVDSAGNAIVAVQFTGYLMAGKFPLKSAKNGSGLSNLLLKVSPSGVVLWATKFDRDNGNAVVNALAVDPAGNSLHAGELTGSLTVGSTNLKAQGSQDPFLVSLNSAGKVRWATTFPGKSSGTVMAAYAAAMDAKGNAAVACAGVGSLTVGKTSPSFQKLGGIVAGLSSAGTVTWTAMASSDTLSVIDEVAFYASGSVVLQGAFQGKLTVGGKTLACPGSTGCVPGNKTNEYFATISASGKVMDASVFPAPVSRFTLHSSGDRLVSGSLKGTLSLGGKTATQVDSADFYVARVKASGKAAWL